MRITWVEIDLSAIRHNLEVIKERVFPAKIIAVVKANAYGHGIVRIAREVSRCNVDYLGVGFLEEGLLLRRKGITAPILVLGGVLFRQIRRFLDNDLDITVSSLELAYAVNKEAQKLNTKAKIHLKIDTGLNRIGINYRRAPLVFERLTPLQNIEITGIYSHFSTADDPDCDFTKIQLKRFEKVLATASRYGIHPQFTHIACSAAIEHFPLKWNNMIRVGLALYGLHPSVSSPRILPLKPVLSFKSRVVFLKNVRAGEPISYGRTYYTQQKTKIATIPVGYGDGYTRRLSNKGYVIIQGKKYPVVGSVCMDQILVDIGQKAHIKVGDEVILYGCQGEHCISIEQIADTVGTIPYEVVCSITRRVPRVYIDTRE